MPNRTPMIEVDWFNPTERLAIADVVYVEGIGLCSHQPLRPCDGHMVMDYKRFFYTVETDRLFEASQDERRLYWNVLEDA